jgi:hypothetical protein
MTHFFAEVNFLCGFLLQYLAATATLQLEGAAVDATYYATYYATFYSFII